MNKQALFLLLIHLAMLSFAELTQKVSVRVLLRSLEILELVEVHGRQMSWDLAKNQATLNKPQTPMISLYTFA
jgi:hypothetical protein